MILGFTVSLLVTLLKILLYISSSTSFLCSSLIEDVYPVMPSLLAVSSIKFGFLLAASASRVNSYPVIFLVR